MNTKANILKDARVESVRNITIDAFSGETGYELELKQGYSFDAFADNRLQVEDTLKDVALSLDLVYPFDGPYAD